MKGQQRQQNAVDLGSKLSKRLLVLHLIKYFRDGYLVGEMIIAPIWCFLMASSTRSSLSTTGIRNAKVFPLPVTACRMLDT